MPERALDANFFLSASLPKESKLSNQFNKSTRRANHFGLSENRVKPIQEKYFGFPETKIDLYLCPSRPTQEGRCATYRRGAGKRWTWMARLTRAPEADGEIVWSRHPKGWCQVRRLRQSRTTVAKVHGSPRRSRISRKLPRRESRMFPLNLYARVRLFYHSIAHETAGAARIRLSLRPLTEEGVTLKSKPRAKRAARLAKVCHSLNCHRPR